MGHIIETAKSGRAKCRKCKKGIAKGEPRFGHEVENTFSPDGGMVHRWYHLACGAEARPAELGEALAAFSGEIPDRAALERQIAQGKRKQKPSRFPYGERAPSARSGCILCGERIQKGDLRVAVEREFDTGVFVTSGAGYLHPGCALEHVDDEGLVEAIKANSTALSKEELDELVELIGN